MRLVSFGPAGAERPGVLDGERVIDVCAVDPALPTRVRAILAAGALDAVARAARRAPSRHVVPRADVRLGPPVTDPAKIVCLGRNYPAHAAEQDREPPPWPLLFAKTPNALCGDGDVVAWPAGVEELDWEVELAFVVGRRARRVPRSHAREVVAGYTVFIDLSARDLQRREKQWYRAKSFDGAAPMGPALVTADEVPDPHDLAIALDVDGETMQSSRTGEMVFDVDAIVEHVTATITLEPGDVVATGTPAGVGAFRHPPRFLAPGSRVSARIEHLGELTVTIGGRETA